MGIYQGCRDAPELINASGNDKFTPLHMARIPEAIQTLLEAGASPNAKNNFGSNPLLLAIETNNDAAVKAHISFGLKHGLDINSTTQNGWTALHRAARIRSNPEIIKMLAESGANKNIVHPEIGTLIQLCVNDINSGSSTIEHLKTLVDVDARDSKGSTALIVAVGMTAEPEVVSILADRTKDINARNKRDQTLLMEAAGSDKDNTALIKVLVKAGADVNASDGKTTVLMSAISGQNPLNVKPVLDAGADINLQVNDGGATALYYAAGLEGFDSAEIINLLFDYGAYINRGSSKTGKTPLDNVISSENTLVAEMLMKVGAIRNARDCGLDRGV